MPQSNSEELIHGLMNDITGGDISMSKEELSDTITGILNKNNLSTDLSFVERVATMKFPNKNESITLDSFPKELQNAASLPVSTIADITLRQDLDMIVSQIPEWFNALQITRDAICEADVVDGTLSRSIVFDRTKMDDVQQANIISKIEAVEEKLGLHAMIKNHVVFNTLFYGEGYVYVVPYAKVFEDLYRYRLKSSEKQNTRSSVASMFETSSALKGYGYGEAAVERSLNDCVVQESSKRSKKQNRIFTESEIMEIIPDYHSKIQTDDNNTESTVRRDESFDAYTEYVSNNIRYIEDDIALPVIEQSANDLRRVYEVKYQGTEFVQEAHNVFEAVMDSDGNPNSIGHEFQNIRGVYLKILPATKMIPIRIDRTIVGYYYISDLTRPEQAGERRNSGLSGYGFRAPAVGHDTFSPDRIFYEKLATKIINNFSLKFMRDNTALHQQIVAILEAHRFNESMMRFIYIPAEHVCQCTINEDGAGKGHSMLEGGLTTARMYMFLKLYSILYQINNSAIRVYNLRQSGIDKNYKQFVQQAVRKFAARRITSKDILNCSSMEKVTGGSELIMPTGTDNNPPLTIESIPAAEAPINTELLDNLRAEAINSTPVPAIMVQNGGVTEIEFSKETELANTRFNSFISSCKIDFNRDITKLYRVVLRWESDIDQETLHDLKFMFRMPTAKHLSVTSEKLSNFEALAGLAVSLFLTEKEQKDSEGNENPATNIVRAYKRQLLAKFITELDVDVLEELANNARNDANKETLDQANHSENLMDNENIPEEGEV